MGVEWQKTLIAAAAILGCTSASAQDWLRLGAAQSSVEREFQTRGYKLSRTNDLNVMASRPGDFYNLHFCDGRLHSHSNQLVGGIRQFIKTAALLQEKYKVSLGDAIVHPKTNEGEVQILTLTWLDPPEKTVLTYIPATGRISEGVSLERGLVKSCKEVRMEGKP